MKAYICRCNNCMGLFLDTNPQNGAREFEVPFSILSLEYIPGLIYNTPNTGNIMVNNENEGSFWGCPVCETDAYLTDVEGLTDVLYIENILKAQTILEFKETAIPVYTGGNAGLGSGIERKYIIHNDSPVGQNEQGELEQKNYGQFLFDTVNNVYYPIEQFDNGEREFLLERTNFV